MQFENSFDVPLPPERAWPILMDIARIAPCVPGAKLTGQVDDHTYKGDIGVRLGPVALVFNGTARFEDVDAVAHTASVKAAGTDAKGRGGANATAAFHLDPIPTGTRVVIRTDLTLSGAVGQYGRGAGMIEAVATQIIKQFAQALHAQIAADPSLAAPTETAVAETAPAETAPVTPPAPAAAKPISGFSLLLKALWSWIAGAFTSKAPGR